MNSSEYSAAIDAENAEFMHMVPTVLCAVIFAVGFYNWLGGYWGWLGAVLGAIIGYILAAIIWLIAIVCIILICIGLYGSSNEESKIVDVVNVESTSALPVPLESTTPSEEIIPLEPSLSASSSNSIEQVKSTESENLTASTPVNSTENAPSQNARLSYPTQESEYMDNKQEDERKVQERFVRNIAIVKHDQETGNTVNTEGTLDSCGGKIQIQYDEEGTPVYCGCFSGPYTCQSKAVVKAWLIQQQSGK